VILTVGVGAFFWGNKTALSALKVERARATQLGNDMQADDFYSTYRESTLLVTARVQSIQRASGSLLVNLHTASAYGVQCQMQNPALNVRPDQTITFVTEGAAADREPHGVRLIGCTIP
jgi:hypothetical protein